MISSTTKKWQKKVEDLEKSLKYKNNLADQFAIKLTVVNAKLERFENQEIEEKIQVRNYVQELEGQTMWLRNLVEKLAIRPETLNVVLKADRERSQQIFDHNMIERKERQNDRHCEGERYSAAKMPVSNYIARKGMGF